MRFPWVQRACGLPACLPAIPCQGAENVKIASIAGWKTGNSCAGAPRVFGQGPSPLPQHHAAPWPVPAPPLAGASPPPGRALAFCWSRACQSTGQRSVRAGETRVAFPDLARRDESTASASMAGAIAPATSPRWDEDQPGAKAPGQRPTRPRRALLARRAGRWPLLFPGQAVFRAAFRTGGGNAGRVS